ncbi:hypothetical protein, partial [Cronobacter sakazakii]|uniref:hypothetical protein n=1 Tax=Cronobacter sakazakii TaxID=28141 RepID=UPI001F21AE76
KEYPCRYRYSTDAADDSEIWQVRQKISQDFRIADDSSRFTIFLPVKNLLMALTRYRYASGVSLYFVALLFAG